MKKLISLLAAYSLIALGAAPHAAAGSYKNIASDNPLSWLRSSSSDFGCMMEKEFGSRDAIYHCAMGKVPTGDPCKDTHNYYAGPEFPKKEISRISPSVEAINLSWEHAELQGVSIDFKTRMTKEEIEKALKIDLNATRENVMSASIQDCAIGKSCLVLQGFDHMGAGDVECP